MEEPIDLGSVRVREAEHLILDGPMDTNSVINRVSAALSTTAEKAKAEQREKDANVAEPECPDCPDGGFSDCHVQIAQKIREGR